MRYATDVASEEGAALLGPDARDGCAGVSNPWMEYSTALRDADVIFRATRKKLPKLTTLRMSVKRTGTSKADSIKACPDLEALNTLRLAEGGFISISNMSGSNMSGARLEGSAPSLDFGSERISNPPFVPSRHLFSGRTRARYRPRALPDGHACDN
jgi:hypothetical protein